MPIWFGSLWAQKPRSLAQTWFFCPHLFLNKKFQRQRALNGLIESLKCYSCFFQKLALSFFLKSKNPILALRWQNELVIRFPFLISPSTFVHKNLNNLCGLDPFLIIIIFFLFFFLFFVFFGGRGREGGEHLHQWMKSLV